MDDKASAKVASRMVRYANSTQSPIFIPTSHHLLELRLNYSPHTILLELLPIAKRLCNKTGSKSVLVNNRKQGSSSWDKSVLRLASFAHLVGFSNVLKESSKWLF